jgi:Bacterial Ig-like domain (group 3)
MHSINRTQLTRSLTIGLVLTLATSAAPAAAAGKPPKAGSITRIADDVWSGNHRVTKPTTLHPHELIRTMGDGEAELKINLAHTNCTTTDQDRIRIAPKPNVVLQLLEGELVCSMHGGNPEIPPVLRGTPAFSLTSTDPVFALIVRKGKTTVKVTRGYVVVGGRSGRRAAVLLGRQQQVAVSAGQDPQLPHPIALTQAEQEALARITAPLPPITDKKKPKVQISNAPAKAVTSSAASFTFAADEHGAVFACALDAELFHPCANTTTYSGLAPGTHTVAVTATDAAGNTSPAAVYSWTIDTRPPLTTITTQQPSITSATTATFAFTADEKQVSFQCQLDTTPYAPCVSPVTYTNPLSEGKHSFSVRASDPAGNLGPAATVSWTIDVTAPKVAITNPPAAITKTTDATFTFTADKAPVSFGCQLDSAAFASCASPKLYSRLSEGKHTFSVRATDAAGNTGNTTYIWTVDITPPSMTITSTPSNPTYARNASFTFSASETPVTYTCRLDNGPSMPCSNPQTYTGLTVGTHTFLVTPTDAAGNVGHPNAYSWTIYYLIT